MDEVWKPIEGFEKIYFVSNLGQIKSCARKKERILKPSIRTGGYYYVTLQRNGKKSQRRIHTLVLAAFIGPCPPKHESRHLDGHPSRNCLENLKWGTKLENAEDKRRHGTMCIGEKHGRAKITAADAMAIREKYAQGSIQKDLAKSFGIVQSKISAIVRRELWSHI